MLWPNTDEKMLAMPTASDGAPPVRANNVAFAHLAGQRIHLLDGDRETPAGNRRDGCFSRCADDAGRAVDGEVDARDRAASLRSSP